MIKRLRSLSVFMALVSVVFMILSLCGVVDLVEWQEPVELFAGLLIALGVLTDTGKEPEALTLKKCLEKLKSPLAVNSIFTLAVFFIYRYAMPGSANVIVNTLSTILFIVFGVAVENNPNARNTFK